MLAVLGLIVLASAALADEPKLETESYLIPSADRGIQLYIRNKHAAGVTSFAGDKILLYVHGATYPSETAFDLPLNGRSMMDYIAQQGFDVYLVDVRGYGASTRPPEMDRRDAQRMLVKNTSSGHAEDGGLSACGPKADAQKMPIAMLLVGSKAEIIDRDLRVRVLVHALSVRATPSPS